MYKEKRNNKLLNGLTTTGKTRPLMIDALFSLINEDPTIVKSSRLALELIGLTEKGKTNKIEGDKDDLALATALAFYVRVYDQSIIFKNKDLFMNQFKDIISTNSNEIEGLPIGTKGFEKIKHDIFSLNEGGVPNIPLGSSGEVNLLDHYFNQKRIQYKPW